MKKITAIALLLVLTLTEIFAQEKINPFLEGKMCRTTPVKSQGNTGSCWSFSTTSFIESEMMRLGKDSVELSEMFVVRKTYLDKAINYVRYHGNASFSQGALAHDLMNVYKNDGMMPEEFYPGLKGTDKHDHTLLEKELKNYLDTIIARGKIQMGWKDTVEAILDKHLGALPEVFQTKDGIFSPKSYATRMGLNPDDYVELTSFYHHPFYQKFVLEIPDNFSGGSYYNITPDELMRTMTNALEKGYSVEWDGDVSEPGFMPDLGIAMLYDKKENVYDVYNMPQERMITISLRQMGFDTYETTDDHLMHIVGLAGTGQGNTMFKVKNSWGNKSGFDGYLYMSYNYMQIKTISIMVHKDAIPQDVRIKLKGL